MRYRVLDLPVRGVGAFTPLASTNPAASSYGLVKVSALLGLVPIPVPAPTQVWAPQNSADKRTQPSNVVPSVILPSQYVAYADNMGPAADAGVGMALRRRGVIPVPAIGAIYSANQAMRSPKIGGRYATRWPRAFQRFNRPVPRQG